MYLPPCIIKVKSSLVVKVTIKWVSQTLASGAWIWTRHFKNFSIYLFDSCLRGR
nr:MAG TPA: hypothetical protein [Bacteriophage sp.]